MFMYIIPQTTATKIVHFCPNFSDIFPAKMYIYYKYVKELFCERYNSSLLKGNEILGFKGEYLSDKVHITLINVAQDATISLLPPPTSFHIPA